MSIRPAHLRFAAEALGLILPRRAPADAILRAQFQRTRAGSKDRAAISALVYGVLRNYFPLRAELGEAAAPLDLITAHAERGVLPGSNLLPTIEGALIEQYGADEAARLAAGLNEPATVDLRVNTLKGTREAAIAALAEDNIAAVPLPGTPNGLRLAKREALQRTRALRQGLIEPQDEGSQRLAEFVAAKPGELVADFCAGAGGKTLALGAAMKNEGELWAFDVNKARIAPLADRVTRAGLTIVREQMIRDENDTRLQAHTRKFNAVLVDSPCSALGTLRRNPELRLTAPDLPALADLQGRILAAAAKLVREGGRLIYATCSVLRAENEDVVAAFLAAHPDFRQQGDPMVLLPHRDGTDGFFAVRLRRK